MSLELAHAAEDYPPFDKVIEGYTKITPAAEDSRMMYDMYVNDKDGAASAGDPQELCREEILHRPYGRQRTDFCLVTSGRLLRPVAAIQQAARVAQSQRRYSLQR